MKVTYQTGSPLAHTIAIAEAAREYVRQTRLAEDMRGEGGWTRAHDALIAAVDAERTNKEET